MMQKATCGHNPPPVASVCLTLYQAAKGDMIARLAAELEAARGMSTPAGDVRPRHLRSGTFLNEWLE